MSNHLLDIFASSPFGALKTHMHTVAQTVSFLKAGLQAALRGDWPAALLEHGHIVCGEQEADNLKKNIRLHLPQTLWMPVPRGDLLDLLAMQDKIANQAKDISTLVMERRMHFPVPLCLVFERLLDKSLESVEQAKKAVDQLDLLIETGFKGHAIVVVEDMIHVLDQLEEESDDYQKKAHAALFAIEKEYPPIDVIFLYKAIDLTARLANRAQRVGHRLQLLLAR